MIKLKTLKFLQKFVFTASIKNINYDLSYSAFTYLIVLLCYTNFDLKKYAQIREYKFRRCTRVNLEEHYLKLFPIAPDIAVNNYNF